MSRSLSHPDHDREQEQTNEPRSRMTLSQGRGGGGGSSDDEARETSYALDLLRLRQTIDRATADQPTMSELVDRLGEAGVRVIPSIQSSGRLNGMSYEVDGIRVKGASVGRAYTAKGLQQAKGVQYDAQRDDPRLWQAAAGRAYPNGKDRDSAERQVAPVLVREQQDRRYRIKGPAGISPAQQETLAEIGRFRTVALPDLLKTKYQGDYGALRQDVIKLKTEKLVQWRTVPVSNPREQGNTERAAGSGKKQESLSVLVLTRKGKGFLKHKTDRTQDHQAVYAGFVKPNEVAHDAAIYRMYQAEAGRIEREGGKIHRVVLDYELKKRVFSPLAKSHDLPALEYARKQEEVAQENGLKVVEGKIPLPDLRIEYETAEGERTKVDLELATDNYRNGHIREKAQAGFKMYAAESSSRLAAVFDDHDLVGEILSF